MTGSTGRPKGGKGAARPDAQLLLPVEITDPDVLRAWVTPFATAVKRLGANPAELTPAALGARLLQLAAARRLDLLLVDGVLELASTCADTPACCRVAGPTATNNNSNGEPTP